jgi:nucleotide-binding universal stress UspA family protein
MPGSPHSGAAARERVCPASSTKEADIATIVCGVDESPGAVDALRVADALSGDLDVRLVLAHVAAGWAGGADDGLTSGQARQGGSLLLERTAREHSIEAERRVEVGETAEELARIAAEEGATVIVVGSRRHGRWRPKLRSRLADELAATAPCPVVVVPPSARR